MLNEAGRLMGDLTVARLDGDRFWLTGSYYLQDWHLRWFRAHLPPNGVTITNITDGWMGFSVSGPASRAILAELAHDDVVERGVRVPCGSGGWTSARRRPSSGRISLTGELGYEIVVPANRHRTLLHELREAGEPHGLRLIGDRAIDSLRLEKGYGIWSAEFRQDYTPAMAGLDRFVAFDKDDFVGADAVRRARDEGPAQRLVLLEVDATDADASADEGIWVGDRRVGFVTSGAYGHHVGASLALAYLDRDVAETAGELTVYVVGDPRTARILPEIPYDPKGLRLRDLDA